MSSEKQKCHELLLHSHRAAGSDPDEETLKSPVAAERQSATPVYTKYGPGSARACHVVNVSSKPLLVARNSVYGPGSNHRAVATLQVPQAKTERKLVRLKETNNNNNNVSVECALP